MVEIYIFYIVEGFRYFFKLKLTINDNSYDSTWKCMFIYNWKYMGVNMGICDYLQYEIYCWLTWKYVHVQYVKNTWAWWVQRGNICLFVIWNIWFGMHMYYKHLYVYSYMHTQCTHISLYFKPMFNLNWDILSVMYTIR